jgi:hypothetical protein
MNDETMKELGFEFEDGIAKLTKQAEGAIPNGTMVEKINSKPGEDGHDDGALARVMGSLLIPPGMTFPWGEAKYLYCVTWKDDPAKRPVFIVDWRVK